MPESVETLRDQLNAAPLSVELRAQLDMALTQLEMLETQFEQALEQAKLLALKDFAYGASHEINNPLANISTRAQTLLATEEHPEKRRSLAVIISQAMRAHEMISDLMLFAKPPALQRSEVSILPLCEQVRQEIQTEFVAKKATITLAVQPPTLIFWGDATQLAIALKCLVRNACEASSVGSEVNVQVLVQDEQLVMSVHDHGPGISEETRSQLFNPFFRGREAGRGLGFGLPKCWGIAQLHGGRMEVTSRLGLGSTFQMLLPIHSESSS